MPTRSYQRLTCVCSVKDRDIWTSHTFSSVQRLKTYRLTDMVTLLISYMCSINTSANKRCVVLIVVCLDAVMCRVYVIIFKTPPATLITPPQHFQHFQRWLQFKTNIFRMGGGGDEARPSTGWENGRCKQKMWMRANEMQEVRYLWCRVITEGIKYLTMRTLSVYH